MQLERGLWPETFVAAVATLTVAWPITELLRDNTWLLQAIPLIALVGVVGALLRSLGVAASLIAIGQLLVAAAAVSQSFLRETLWRGALPTGESVRLAGALLREAGTVLQTYAAPAPTTVGVSFLLVSVLTLTAISVDSIAVTGRAPATAGIPLAAGFMVSVSNNGEAMEPWYFLAAAAAWLVMVFQQGNRVLQGWSSASRRESVGSHDVNYGPTGHRQRARTLGALTLVVAVLGAAALPHLPPTFFGDGLARNPDARGVGDGAGQVTFTETMDPASDLRDRSQAPVLSYRTSAREVQPLRVTATEEFSDGQWQPPERNPEDLTPAPDSSWGPPAGLNPEVPTLQAEIRVSDSELRPPHLAIPSPTRYVRIDAPWQLNTATDAVVLDAPAQDYAAGYLSLAGELPGNVGQAQADPADFRDELLRVDPAGEEAIAALTEDVVGDATNDLQVAVRLQDHLRGGLYRYSLDLLDSTANDPISAFLETRQGYCVQFATAMVMAARHEGIPARMAVGFLPGTLQDDGDREVIAADAHTWPELWIDQLGWTRFEPTPGVRAGAPPTYADDALEQAPAVPTETTEPTTEPVPEPDTAPEAGGETGWQQILQETLPILGRVIGVLGVLALLIAVVPWAGRRHRRSGLRTDGPVTDRVEGQWLWLTRSLEDLGVEPPRARSPREMDRHYRQVTALDRRGREALTRVTATLERARYAPETAQDAGDLAVMEDDARMVLDEVAENLPWNIRVNAAVLPRSGFTALRERVSSLLRRR